MIYDKEAHEKAIEALEDLLAELPADFSFFSPDETRSRSEFRVIKKSNVRAVHEALWQLQLYFGLQED